MHGASDDPRRLRVRSKVWVERDGEVVISDYRATLLRAVAEAGSVAGAAAALGLPVRTAWKKLREMEEAAGVALLASDSGGAGGGQSELTPVARQMLEAFERVEGTVAREVEARFDEVRRSFES